MKRKAIGLFIVFVITLGLSACRVVVTPADVSVNATVRFGIEVSPVIQRFEPTRGSGSSYGVGEAIAFQILTDRSGYVTLSAIDPDGSVYVFARNLYVTGGQPTTLSGLNSRTVFTLQPPRGLHRVRASFTPSPTTSSANAYINVRGESSWTRIIINDVEPFNVRDIAETRFFLQ
ncbi:MAG: DUF4384 domain-containing protein [Trueperaceae bacterium]